MFLRRIKNYLWPLPPWAAFHADEPAGDPSGGGGTAVADPPAATTEPPALPDWMQENPDVEDLVGDEAARNVLARYPDKKEAYKALIEQHKTIRSGFKLPDELTEEAMSQIEARVNKHREVPESSDGYDLARPEEIPEELDFSDDSKIELRAFARAANIGKANAQGLYEKLLQMVHRAQQGNARTQKEETQKQADATAESLKTYWGPQEYERMIKLMPEYTKATALDEDEHKDFEAQLDATGMRNHPMMQRLLGDAARRWQILEGNAQGLTEFQASEGKQKLTDAQKRQQTHPNTPVSLGGGKPD